MCYRADQAPTETLTLACRSALRGHSGTLAQARVLGSDALTISRNAEGWSATPGALTVLGQTTGVGQRLCVSPCLSSWRTCRASIAANARSSPPCLRSTLQINQTATPVATVTIPTMVQNAGLIGQPRSSSGRSWGRSFSGAGPTGRTAQRSDLSAHVTL